MMSKGFYQDKVKFAETDGSFRALKLPYKGSNIVAIAVLPDEGKYGLNADAALTGIGLDKILGAYWQPASKAEPKLRVQMPKFKIKLDTLPVGQVGQASPGSTRLLVVLFSSVACTCATLLA